MWICKTCSSSENGNVPFILGFTKCACDGMQATYNSLFLGYIKNGKMEDLRKAIAAMKEREISPTNLSLQTIISGLLEYQQIDDLLAYLPDLKVTNTPPTH